MVCQLQIPPSTLGCVLLEEELWKPHFPVHLTPYLAPPIQSVRARVRSAGRRAMLLCSCFLFPFSTLPLVCLSALHPAAAALPSATAVSFHLLVSNTFGSPFRGLYGAGPLLWGQRKAVASERSISKYWFKMCSSSDCLFIWMDINQTIILIMCVEITANCIVFPSPLLTLSNKILVYT